MCVPQTTVKVFTKYDAAPKEIIEVLTPIPNIKTPDFSMTDCYFTNQYRLSYIESGLEGAQFVHYEKIETGIFIGEPEG